MGRISFSFQVTLNDRRLNLSLCKIFLQFLNFNKNTTTTLQVKDFIIGTLYSSVCHNKKLSTQDLDLNFSSFWVMGKPQESSGHWLAIYVTLPRPVMQQRTYLLQLSQATSQMKVEVIEGCFWLKARDCPCYYLKTNHYNLFNLHKYI